MLILLILHNREKRPNRLSKPTSYTCLSGVGFRRKSFRMVSEALGCFLIDVHIKKQKQKNINIEMSIGSLFFGNFRSRRRGQGLNDQSHL